MPINRFYFLFLTFPFVKRFCGNSPRTFLAKSPSCPRPFPGKHIHLAEELRLGQFLHQSPVLLHVWSLLSPGERFPLGTPFTPVPVPVPTCGNKMEPCGKQIDLLFVT